MPSLPVPTSTPVNDLSSRARFATAGPRDGGGELNLLDREATAPLPRAAGEAEHPVDAEPAAGLRWPPTAEDLDAVDVLVLDDIACALPVARWSQPSPATAPAVPASPARGPATSGSYVGERRATAALGTAESFDLPDILYLDDEDADAFAAEGTLRSAGQTTRRSSTNRLVRPITWMAAAAALVIAAVYVSVSSWTVDVPVQPLHVAVPAVADTAAPLVAATTAAPTPVPETELRAYDSAPAEEPTDPADGGGDRPVPTPVATPGPLTRLPASDGPAPGASAGALAGAGIEARSVGSAGAVPERSSLATTDSAAAPVATRLDVDLPPPMRLPAAGLAGATLPPTVPGATLPPPAPAIASAPAPVTRPAAPAIRDDTRIQGVLNRYEAAYGQLDARAAQAVWPSVDVTALSRAFDGLESQTVHLGNCQFDVADAVAQAECVGSTTYVPRVGSRSPRTEMRSWTFQLRRVGEQWEIETARIR